MLAQIVLLYQVVVMQCNESVTIHQNRCMGSLTSHIILQERGL